MTPPRATGAGVGDGGDRQALGIDVAWRIRAAWRAVPLLVRVARHVARREGFSRGSLSIAVVGARRMARLHAETTGIRGSTDVLTFELGTSRRRGLLEAEIVVCADEARRRARPFTLAAARAELALYLAHGLLHLSGYDDHDPAAFRRMHEREDDLLRELGVGAVFWR